MQQRVSQLRFPAWPPGFAYPKRQATFAAKNRQYDFRHSEKPESFYDLVRAASHPPYGEAFQRIERSPNLVFGHLARLSALGHLGRLAEAKQAAKRLRELSPGFTVARYLSIHPIRDAAYRKRSAEILRLTGLP